MFWVNGQLAESLPLTDRSIHYGDGCFTTCRVLSGEILLQELHLQRLQHCAEALLITGIDWQKLNQEMKLLAQQLGDGVLKAMLSRGSTGRGYSMGADAKPRRILSTSAFPQHYNSWREEGITLAISSLRLARNPRLAGIKHLNRLEQVLIRAELDQWGAREAVVLDSEGVLVECCSANLFWRRGNRVFTPRLDQAGVAGVMRQFILHRLAQTSYRTEQVHCSLETLADVDEVLICNSLMPLLSVSQVAGWHYRSQELYNALLPYCLL